MEQESNRERHYKKLPIEQNESYKWIESSVKTKVTLSEAGLVGGKAPDLNAGRESPHCGFG